MRVRVKICGITSPGDALAAVEAGADALGFMLFDGSPRHIKLKALAEFARTLPPFVSRVGVFVNAQENFVREAIEAGIDTLQFHGDETPEFCRRFRLPVYKAFRVQDATSLQQLPQYETSAWLLDACVPGVHGGTGQSFNWDLATAAKTLGRPVILAGGLSPENVAEAVSKVAPYAVDVSSGVEAAPGRKDHQKLKLFVNNTRMAAARL